jgi:hypothetical protein
MARIDTLLPMTPSVPPNVPIRQALDRSEPLARLTQRLRESSQRLLVVQTLLPQAMRPLVRSGPLDAEGWTVLADNGAIAAKLRHMVPVMQQRLEAEGWQPLPIRVKVLGAA